MFEPTKENAIRDMRMAKLFFITKDGKFYSSIANEYIEKMSVYAIYCKEETKENWIKTIESLIEIVGEVRDGELELELLYCEQTAEIMECLSNGASWEEIKQVVKKQGHSGMGISMLGQKILYYSPYGIEFVDKIIGKKYLKLLSCLNEEYEKQIKVQKEKELVLKLNNQCNC